MPRTEIYDDQKLARQLNIQKKKAWDMDADINWDRGIDLDKYLLPLDKNMALFPETNAQQKKVISQLLGLIVASTISQFETIANDLKDITWEKFLRKYPVNPEMFELGQQFFDEEVKHSQVFDKYIDMFAKEVNVDPKDLKKFLPQTETSILPKLYKYNSLSGGMAVWWLISAVEEESILFYQYIRGVKEDIDPLYYQIHRLHFEEEVRHKNYASLMLDVYREFNHNPQSIFFKKLDFVLTEIINISWTFKQLLRVKELKKFENHHPFFKTTAEVLDIISDQNPFTLLNKLFTTTPYISDTLNLSAHNEIQRMLAQNKTAKIPFIGSKQRSNPCFV